MIRGIPTNPTTDTPSVVDLKNHHLPGWLPFRVQGILSTPDTLTATVIVDRVLDSGPVPVRVVDGLEMPCSPTSRITVEVSANPTATSLLLVEYRCVTPDGLGIVPTG